MKPISELPEHWQIWYQEWDTSVPENKHKQHLKADLLSVPGSQQSYSAAFELFLFSMFSNMGLCVEFQPAINGVNPDFCISDKRGCSAYVEAGMMFSDPLETENSFRLMGVPIWNEFKKLRSQNFSVKLAASSGHPGNVSPKFVKRKVQQWINQLDAAEVGARSHLAVLPRKAFQFKKWRLEVELTLKSPKDKERLGETAVELAGFSGCWSDDPAKRLNSKLEEKSSQVRKTGRHCIVAIAERLQSISIEDTQRALLGGNCEFSFESLANDSHPYVKDLSIPQPKADGLWSPHCAKEPIAVIVHRGNLQYPDHGETGLWLNPNSSYFQAPLPLFALKIHSAVQEIWTRPATKL